MKEYFGKLFLIGLSFYDENNTLIEQYQTHGTLIKIENELLYFHQDDDSIFCLPFSKESIQKAEPGTYRERSTGLEIENPDYLTQWSVNDINDITNIKEYKKNGFTLGDLKN